MFRQFRSHRCYCVVNLLPQIALNNAEAEM